MYSSIPRGQLKRGDRPRELLTLSQDSHCQPEERGSPCHTQKRDAVWVWGVPLAPLTLAETVDLIGELIRAGGPSFFITAPTH